MDRKFDTFIFDLDGTLLDTVPDLTLLTNRILREIGAPEHTQEEILSYVGAGVRRLIFLALPPDEPEAKVEEALELWNDLFMDYYEHTEPYDGIPQLLHDLRERGDKLGVVSNKLQSGVDRIMDLKLPAAVDVMYGDSEKTPRKPDPTGILNAMDVLGAVPERTIYIGDSPSDIVAGKRAGCATAAVLWGYHDEADFGETPESTPDICVSHPLDLLHYSA